MKMLNVLCAAKVIYIIPGESSPYTFISMAIIWLLCGNLEIYNLKSAIFAYGNQKGLWPNHLRHKSCDRLLTGPRNDVKTMVTSSTQIAQCLKQWFTSNYSGVCFRKALYSHYLHTVLQQNYSSKKNIHKQHYKLAWLEL